MQTDCWVAIRAQALHAGYLEVQVMVLFEKVQIRQQHYGRNCSTIGCCPEIPVATAGSETSWILHQIGVSCFDPFCYPDLFLQ